MAQWGDINPATGKKYSIQEIQKLNSGIDISGGATAVSTSSTTAPAATGAQGVWYEGQYLGDVGSDFSDMSQAEKEAWIKENFGVDVAGQIWGFGGAPASNIPPPPDSGSGTGTGGVDDVVGGVPALPPYTPSAELTALTDQIGGAISDILEQGGLGIGEEVKDQMFLKEAEMINASNAQAIKNMEDEMARRGMSNSGQVFSETMNLNAKSDIQMANSMRDIEIADAYMKLASYENAIGMGVQFLSYLSEESWRQYQPTFYQWQAQVDMYKMAIENAYAIGRMDLAHKYDLELAQFEADTAIQLEEMKLEAANAAAASQGVGSIFGTILGWLIPGS